MSNEPKEQKPTRDQQQIERRPSHDFPDQIRKEWEHQITDWMKPPKPDPDKQRDKERGKGE
jgi:hypothetical protein